jgi:glutathione synthase/RimK-type ligase-like ATP-grasp enzyme
MTSRPPLLIVTHREDLAADFVIVRLRERGLAYYRLNSDELATSAIMFRAGCGTLVRTLATADAAIDLERVRSVWYRRAIRPLASDRIDTSLRPFVAAELRHVCEGLIADPGIRWVNPLESSELAERKVFQLRIAERHGLLIPPTIISSDRAELSRFVTEEGRVICKPISQGLVSSDEGLFAIHTHEIRSEELQPTSMMEVTPTLLQRLIPKGTDIRLTIIGEAIFPVEVITPAGAPIDWRATRQGLAYRSCNLPVQVEQACRSFMAALNIVFGAFDFVRTDDGQWFFLEVNPAGEWAWLEVELNLPMRDALIDLLYDHEF